MLLEKAAAYEKTSYKGLFIEIFAHTAHDHNWELKTFALMDTHNSDYVLVFPDHVCLTEIHIIFLQFINVTHKVKQKNGEFKHAFGKSRSLRENELQGTVY